MKSYELSVNCAFLVSVCALLSTGCSFIFVKAPAASAEEFTPTQEVKCTSSKVAPVLDTIFTGLQVVRTAVAVGADDSVYQNPNQPLSRGADVALGVGFTALFLSSAIYGYVTTASCERAQRAGGYPPPRRHEDQANPSETGDVSEGHTAGTPESAAPPSLPDSKPSWGEP